MLSGVLNGQFNGPRINRRKLLTGAGAALACGVPRLSCAGAAASGRQAPGMNGGPSPAVEINGRRVQVAGFYRLGISFAIDGTVVTSDLNFLRLVPGHPPGLIEIGLVQLTPGANPFLVRDDLARTLPGVRLSHFDCHRRSSICMRKLKSYRCRRKRPHPSSWDGIYSVSGSSPCPTLSLDTTPVSCSTNSS